MSTSSTLGTKAGNRTIPPSVDMTEALELADYPLTEEGRPTRKGFRIPAIALVLVVLAVALLLAVPYIILVGMLSP